MPTQRPSSPSTARPLHPASTRELQQAPVAKPTPEAKRARSRAFDDDPKRRPKSGTSFFKLKNGVRLNAGRQIRAYVSTACFAGKSVAVFRESDLEAFIESARAFAERRADVVGLQGGTFTADGMLLQVLVGLHIYHPGDNPGLAAARIVVASPESDDLVTATLQSAPLLIAQFADQMAALADGARDTALLIGQ